MLPNNHRRHVALGLVLAAGALPASAAARTDTPARDTGAQPATAAAGGVNLSSPDARDAAAGIDLGRTAVPQVDVVKVSTGSSFDWGDAAIGAGGAAGLVLLVIGGTVAGVRRRGGSINPLHPAGFAH